MTSNLLSLVDLTEMRRDHVNCYMLFLFDSRSSCSSAEEMIPKDLDNSIRGSKGVSCVIEL